MTTILLGDLPRMLRSIVEGALAGETDLRLAGGAGEADLDAALRRSGADVLIVAERRGRGEAFYRPLLSGHPALKVFVLTPDGRNITLFALRRVRFADASPATLIDAIRTEAERPDAPRDA